MYQDIKKLKYQAIFISPEMCFRHQGGKALLAALGIAKQILAFVIDEAHCIAQWGGEFRPAYGELSQLRAFVPTQVPVMLLSATLTPEALEECERSVLIKPQDAFYVNLGNDRRNIKMEVRPIENAEDFAALDGIFHFDKVNLVSDLPKTLIFADERVKVQQIWRYIRSRLPEFLGSAVDYVHSLRSKRAKRRVMNRFMNAQGIRILVATEAVGMVSVTVLTYGSCSHH